MSAIFRFPMPVMQSIGLVCIPTSDRADAAPIERKPVAAAIVTMSQRDDGHLTIFHEIVTASEEAQFPLCWLLEQELVRGATSIVRDGDLAVLVADAAQQRFFVEFKLGALMRGDGVIDPVELIGHGHDESALCRRLGIPRLVMSDVEAAQLWTWFPRDSRLAALGQQALANAVSRLMLWANLTATCDCEPGFFYETMLALRPWLDEREHDAPALYQWGVARPVMRAVSFVEEYRRDLARRLAGEESDWPEFAPGLFHS